MTTRDFTSVSAGDFGRFGILCALRNQCGWWGWDFDACRFGFQVRRDHRHALDLAERNKRPVRLAAIDTLDGSEEQGNAGLATRTVFFHKG
jgi:hypothetical protein